MEPWFERGHVVVLVPSSRTCRVNPYSGQAHDMARSFCGICRLPQDACDSKKLVTSHAHIASKLSCVQQRTGRLPHVGGRLGKIPTTEDYIRSRISGNEIFTGYDVMDGRRFIRSLAGQ
jgi:hypothetical protein